MTLLNRPSAPSGGTGTAAEAPLGGVGRGGGRITITGGGGGGGGRGFFLRASAALDVSATAHPIVNIRARLAAGVLDGVFIEFSHMGS